MRLPATAFVAVVSFALPVAADAPRVAADIAPIQSLVAQVMDGVGQSDVIVRPGMSPHGYAMRPSEARALDQSDLVIWMGPELTPWLDEAIGTLANDAVVLTLLDNPETITLPSRTGARFEAHDHDDHEDHGHDHGHDEAHDHDHSHDDHAHEGTDPHAWLDPQNADRWLGLIAAELAQVDPDNADAYKANAQQARADLAALSDEIATQLAPLSDRPFLVFHDAYQYFETRFGIAAAGAVSLSDASDPGPARLAELRTLVEDRNIVCAFAEPQFNTAILETVFPDSLRIGTLDPQGVAHPVGAGLYPALLRDMANSMVECLSPKG